MRKRNLAVLCLFVLAGVGTRSGAQPAPVAKPDLFYLVVDKSQSIANNKLLLPITGALVQVVGKLPANTRIEVVFFNDKPTTPRGWGPPLDVTGTGEFAQYVSQVFKPRGNTRLFDTVGEVLERVKSRIADYGRVQVVVLSDGINTVEPRNYRDWAVLDGIAKELHRCNDGLAVTWLTVGDEPGLNDPKNQPPVGGMIGVKAALPNDIARTMDEVAAPSAAFQPIPRRAAVGEAITFVLDHEQNVDVAKWSFGDGTSSPELRPVHPYAKPEKYDVSVEVTGKSGTTRKTVPGCVEVLDAVPLQAAFSPVPTPVRVGQEVRFVDESLGGPTSWRWEFPGGVVDTKRKGTFTFATVKTEVVTLTVGRDGKTNTLPQKIEVLPLPPDPAFTADPPDPVVGQSVRLAAHKTDPSWKHTWKVDGELVGEGDPIVWEASGAGMMREISHEVSNAGGSRPLTRQVYVREKPDDLVARFCCSTERVRAGISVQLFDQSLGGADSWSWDIESVGTDDHQSPRVVFPNAGPVTVALTVKRKGQASLPHSERITVEARELPVVIRWFDAAGREVGAPGAIEFCEVTIAALIEGGKPPTSGACFAIELPPDVPAEASIGLTLSGASAAFIELFDEKTGLALPTPYTVTESGRYGLRLAKQRERQFPADPTASLVFEPKGDLRLSANAPSEIPVAIHARLPEVGIVWKDNSPQRRPVRFPEGIDFGALKSQHVRTGSYNRPATDSFDIEFPSEALPGDSLDCRIAGKDAACFGLLAAPPSAGPASPARYESEVSVRKGCAYRLGVRPNCTGSGALSASLVFVPKGHLSLGKAAPAIPISATLPASSSGKPPPPPPPPPIPLIAAAVIVLLGLIALLVKRLRSGGGGSLAAAGDPITIAIRLVAGGAEGGTGGNEVEFSLAADGKVFLGKGSGPNQEFDGGAPHCWIERGEDDSYFHLCAADGKPTKQAFGKTLVIPGTQKSIQVTRK